jgi:hypothetical protein
MKNVRAEQWAILAYTSCALTLILYVILNFFNPYVARQEPGSVSITGEIWRNGVRSTWPPSGNQSFTEGSSTICLIMMGLAVLAFFMAAFRLYAVMYLIFALQFLPVGFYLLLTPGIFAGIGICNIGYLAAAVGIHRAALRKPVQGTPQG